MIVSEGVPEQSPVVKNWTIIGLPYQSTCVSRPREKEHKKQCEDKLTLAIDPLLLQVEDFGALLGQEVAGVAVNVLVLRGWGRAVEVGVGFDWEVFCQGG